MLFVLVCTEGGVSEPECVKAYLSVLKSQTPQSGEENVDVIPVPLGGNQGYRILTEKADEKIRLLSADEDSLLHYADPDSNIEKWLVCDYDQLDESRITYEKFRAQVEEAGYKLIMNKPNFEYFILALLAGWRVADATHKSNFTGEINKYIDKLNLSNRKNKHFSDALMLPHYSKKMHIAEQLFGMLFHYNPEIIQGIELRDINDEERFSDMPILIDRLAKLYSLT